MEKLLHELYYDPKTGFVSAGVLYKRANAKNALITKKFVDEWLGKQRVAQLHKPARKVKTKGHITTIAPNHRFQADLIDMQSYPSRLKRISQHWILVVVDVFSRKLYARALPSKHVDVVAAAFNDIVKKAPLETPIYRLDTDQGGEFGKTFDRLTNIIGHHRANVGDHRSLGVVDATIRIFKNLVFRVITSEGEWAKHLDALVQNFNDTPREALLGYTPNEVDNDLTIQGAIQNLNIDKRAETRKAQEQQPPFKVGDKVRIPAQTGPFRRGFKKQRSDETYPITKVLANSVIVETHLGPRRFLFSEVNEAGVPLSKDVFEVDQIFEDRTRTIKRGRKNVKQFWVRFTDNDEQWIDEGDILV
eukprot:Lithocolla_globosa_v1_NODE_165_length_5553_cov_13.632479.p1 type:complete len:361 gc:universal NODE_165_length_5553_cov_13.632479:1849-767(-)